MFRKQKPRKASALAGYFEVEVRNKRNQFSFQNNLDELDDVLSLKILGSFSQSKDLDLDLKSIVNT